jgi:hypothetical protein
MRPGRNVVWCTGRGDARHASHSRPVPSADAGFQPESGSQEVPDGGVTVALPWFNCDGR